ncbi:EAL domain-containing protein [Aeribacillus sp. FSL K6-8394]|uniref:EAL domain-containing protein n=1 Tax=Aeribacillus sp. FSL K6-8394 TaxID=2954570 RepID=UPI0030F63A1C
MRDCAVNKIKSVYQPIWNLNNWNIFGYEAFLTFPDSQLNGDIEKVFELARGKGCLYELNIKAILNAITCFPIERLDDSLIFVNLFPSTLIHHQFEKFVERLLKQYPQIQEKVVFQINHTPSEKHIWDLPDLKDKINMLKKNGFDVALYGVGNGTAVLQQIVDFSASYIKLDRHFTKELYRSKEKQHIVSLLVQYAKQQITIILEGIEKEMDLAKAKLLKVPVGQGNLLGKPEKSAVHTIEDIFR